MKPQAQDKQDFLPNFRKLSVEEMDIDSMDTDTNQQESNSPKRKRHFETWDIEMQNASSPSGVAFIPNSVACQLCQQKPGLVFTIINQIEAIVCDSCNQNAW
jgi:hypothetical protein